MEETSQYCLVDLNSKFKAKHEIQFFQLYRKFPRIFKRFEWSIGNSKNFEKKIRFTFEMLNSVGK